MDETMKRYLVTLVSTKRFSVEVTAHSAYEAQRAAEKLPMEQLMHEASPPLCATQALEVSS